jgi:SpoVK/Ycf46/Vps4 family AAA+-type ATPase
VGKTAAVRAVAAEAGAVVHALSAGDVFGPYAGDSEARLRAAFKAAEKDVAAGRPAVLMLDEIDAICPVGLHSLPGVGLVTWNIVAVIN